MSLNIITDSSQVPAAPFYVTCTDTFLSGWGEARGKLNRLIFPCNDHDEAVAVATNARSRTDMKKVSVIESPFSPRFDDSILWQVMDRDLAARWYTPGGFAASES
jgi:hypothetical protein